MTPFNIRPRTPEDDARVVEIMNSLSPEFPPATVEEYRFHFDNAEKDLRNLYLVADVDGRLAAGGAIFEMRNPDATPFFMVVGVDSARQGQGIGTAMYDRLLEQAASWGADRLIGDVLEGRDAGLAFARKRGFEETGHGERHSRLDVSKANLNGFTGEDERLAADGITVKTLAELPFKDQAFMAKLHHVNMEAREDIPGAEPQASTPLDDWLKVVLEGVGRSPEWYWVALDGDTPVGIASLKRSGEDCAWNGFTGTLRAYRGRGIARAMKLKTIEWCRRAGVRYLYTGNEVANRPMLAINESLGYEALPRSITVRKVLGGESPGAAS